MAYSSLTELAKHYYPNTHISTSDSEDTGALSSKLFSKETYNSTEQSEISQWVEKSHQLSSASTDSDQLLTSLNAHLTTRTTVLGHKPSIADLALFSFLAPSAKTWTPEQRTGPNGHHNIVRYLDFIQHAPLFDLTIPVSEQVPVDPNEVLSVPKPIDPKEEKKKKDKAAATAGGAGGSKDGSTTTLPQGQSKKERLKDAAVSAKDTIKDAVAGGAAAVTGGGGGGKKEKKEKAPKQPKQPVAAAKETPLTPALIDLRVGHILKAVKHPDADSLYVSTIAVGDAAGTDNTSEYEGQVVRTVCSGLNGLIPLEEMQGRKIVAVCNLKPVTMRGIKSVAMVLAASPRLKEGEVDNHAGPVELVDPPKEAKAGERIWFEGWEGEPEGVLNPKKKVWEYCQTGFTTTDEMGVAFEWGRVEQFKDKEGMEGKPGLGVLRVKGGGECKVRSLKGAAVR